MTKFKLYFATILALFGVSVSQAQTPDNYTEMRVYLQSMFRMLNKNLVPTGFLLDYGIEYDAVHELTQPLFPYTNPSCLHFASLLFLPHILYLRQPYIFL